MASLASAIVAAELRVIRSRGDLRARVHRMRTRLARPPFLVVAVALGALLAVLLVRHGRASAVASPLATALLLRGLDYLLSRASIPRAGPPTP